MANNKEIAGAIHRHLAEETKGWTTDTGEPLANHLSEVSAHCAGCVEAHRKNPIQKGRG